MATPTATATPPAAAVSTPAKSEATVFVDALYRKVLMAVKASNGIPSEDDDYHYHTKFSTAFASQAESTTIRVQELLWRLSKSNARKDGDGSDDEDDDDDEATSGDLFEGPEPKPRITDLVDTLLDEASRQLDIVARGGAAGVKVQYENTPMVFDKKPLTKNKTTSKDDKDDATTKEQAMRVRQSRATNKPQDRFDESIDNSNAPFASKLREKVHAIDADAGAMDEDEDDALTHPYFPEIRALRYADWQVEAAQEPYEKIPVEEASYLWVDTDAKLRQMMQSLAKADTKVIAVDLEHHSYRSYMGLVCLMQISTAREDFLVDTLALRGQLQVLNQVFCDPSKVKVLHGSDMDILWLQRDLGLYIVNLFDTGQASRLLNYPRYSLAYLLKRHCGIDADKQYQLADWRIRPLEKNMIKYAREDTRYLLYIYDQMKQELLSASDNSRSSLLLEALRNSSKICLQVYSKPVVTDGDCDALSDKLKSTVGIPVLSDLQKRVFQRLYYWRDAVARAEDESHAYVMPNHVLIKIAQHLPLRSDQLFRTCHPVPALVRKHAHELTTMISAEKAKVVADETNATVRDVKMTTSVTPQKRKFDQDEDIESKTFTSASDLSEYAGWKSGKRKARTTMPLAETSSAALAEANSHAASLSVSFAKSTADSPSRVDEVLRHVNELVASTSFVISEYAVETSAAQSTTPAVETQPKRNVEMDTTPQSLSETYHLSKRRKTEAGGVVPKMPTTNAIAAVGASAQETKERTEKFMSEIKSETTTEATEAPPTTAAKAFDYAAASQQVAGAQFKIESTAVAAAAKQRGGRGGRGGGRGKKAGGRGYNPFMAVRGGRGAGGVEEPSGAKAPVKKIHQMPRSSTFR